LSTQQHKNDNAHNQAWYPTLRTNYHVMMNCDEIPFNSSKYFHGNLAQLIGQKLVLGLK